MRAAALAAPVYLAAAVVPPGGLFRGREYRDVGLYGEYSHGFLDGRIPYRDVFVEYPPGALVAWMPPAMLPEDAYRHAFKGFMALVGIGILFAAALILARLGADRFRLYGVLVALALTPLALGPVSLNTYDAWPALLVALALGALLYARPVLAFALLGLAATAKVYPVALLPIFCLALPMRSLGRPFAAFGAVVVAVFGPFLLLDWKGVVESLRAQGGRELQLESLGGAVLAAADRLGLYDVDVVGGSTPAASKDVGGSLAEGLAPLSTALQVAAVLLVVWAFRSGSRDGERLVAAAAATLVGVLAFSRWISPQYLIWLLPLVALVAPPVNVAAAALLACAMVLGQLWFFHYAELYDIEARVWLVLLRDLALVVLYGVLLAAVVRRRTKTPSSSSTFDQSPAASSRASGIAAVDGEERRSR